MNNVVFAGIKRGTRGEGDKIIFCGGEVSLLLQPLFFILELVEAVAGLAVWVVLHKWRIGVHFH